MSFRLLTTLFPAFEDFERRNTTFTGLAGVNAYAQAELRWHGKAVRDIAGDWVTGNYFDLGVQPELGRFFHAADEHGPGSAPYVVASDALWRTTFWLIRVSWANPCSSTGNRLPWWAWRRRASTARSGLCGPTTGCP